MVLHELRLCNYCCLKLHFSFLRNAWTSKCNVSHEKGSFNKHLRDYRFDGAEVGLRDKKSSASGALTTEKKLNATSLKILICMAKIFTTSQQEICT